MQIAGPLLLAMLLNSCEKAESEEPTGEPVVAIGGGGGGGSGAVSSRSISAAPMDLKLTAATPNSITLGWTDIAVNELIFEIESCQGIDCEDFSAVTGSPLSANSVTFTHAGLTAGTPYRFRVRTTNRNGSSPWQVSDHIPRGHRSVYKHHQPQLDTIILGLYRHADTTVLGRHLYRLPRRIWISLRWSQVVPRGNRAAVRDLLPVSIAGDLRWDGF
jgi:hypothetical protein